MNTLPSYSHNMLPICGVKWHQFATQREAERFADWAEWITRKSQRRCTSFIACRYDLPADAQWEVKLRNW